VVIVGVNGNTRLELSWRGDDAVVTALFNLVWPGGGGRTV
jgi:hypothetical protein